MRLADSLNGEIVCVDSMQVYRGMDIGTAKPSASERASVPHHLLDAVEVTESFDAAQFTRLAHGVVSEIQGRNRVPILCGGTGLYFKAFLHGLGETPPGDPTLRFALEATPLPELLRELAGRDPVTFEKIDRQNPRRVIRAVEVIRLTGKPFSAQRARWQSVGADSYQALGIGLERSSGDLRRRIDIRVEQMFRAGLVEETEALLARGLARNHTASQALGYRQVAEHLRGQRSLPETIGLVKIRTWQFAKRQMTWFRRQMALKWFKIEADEAVANVVERMMTEQRAAAAARQ
jgi:tRNA dimethylallyltransferase